MFLITYDLFTPSTKLIPLMYRKVTQDPINKNKDINCFIIRCSMCLFGDILTYIPRLSTLS